jgi:hypothetical protein
MARYALDTLKFERWDSDRWLRLADAIGLIMAERGVDRGQAQQILIKAASGRVQSRYVVALAQGMDSGTGRAYRGIAPAMWKRHDGTINLVKGCYHCCQNSLMPVRTNKSVDYSDLASRYAGEAVIEINAADLGEWLGELPHSRAEIQRFVGDWIDREEKAGRIPKQDALVRAARDAGIRGGRPQMRKAFNDQRRAAGVKVKRGRPRQG